MKTSIRLGKIQGTLLGLAIGDAMGAPVSFCSRGSFEPVLEYRTGGHLMLDHGEWTDDTAMSLCLAESLIEKSFDKSHQLETYLRWLLNGHNTVHQEAIDAGETTLLALAHFAKTGQPESPFCGEAYSGNGSIMRLAPIACYFLDCDEAIFHGGESSRTTHPSPIAVDSCRLLSAVLWALVNGLDRVEAIRFAQTKLPDLHPEIAPIAMGSFWEKSESAIKSTGYCAHTLEAALWAWWSAPDFKTAVLKAVNLGDDADTVGAVTGQLSGAFWGMDGIPKKWVEPLARKDHILEIANRLAGCAR